MACATHKSKVPYPCRFYNQMRCSNTDCTYLHICKGFLDSTCTGCALSHDIKADQPLSVLSAYGFISSQNAETILELYKDRLQRSGNQQNTMKLNPPSICSHYNGKGQKGNKSSHVDSNEDTEYPYLICKNYNRNKCNSPQCKYLHICGKLILDECESKSICLYNLNHRVFYQNNKLVLNGAGYDTDQKEAELFKEYKRKSQKMFAKWKQRQNQPMENKELSRQSTTSETKESRSRQSSGNDRSSGRQDCSQKKQIPMFDESKSRGKYEKGMTKPNIQSEDVDICRNNIRERCRYGENCNRHHCSLPYHWQYKVPTQPWKSFPLVVNETLEMNFCDKDIDNTIVSVANDRCVVDFKQMKGKLRDGELTLRRLSTSSACEAPPGETLVTNWTWYWKHEYKGFLKYTDESQEDVSEIGREIEEKYIENPENTTIVEIRKCLYYIDFRNMKQTNIESQKERDIRRRPEYRSKEDVEKEAKERRKIFRKVDIKQPSMQQQSGGLPNHWANMNDEEEEMKRVLIQQSDKEYMDVSEVFVWSLGRFDVVVESIERIQNPYLWQNYEWKKLRMEKQNKADGVNELRLFHGTSAENVDPISRTNFDWRLYGSEVGSVYGQGSYFAADANYSDSGYARYDKDGFKWMFIVKVLAGNFTAGKSDLRRPPPIDPASPNGRLYDSTVDNPNSPRIYCIFDNSQYYPEYIIKYKYR